MNSAHMPLKALLALTVAVLLAHWALLHEAAFGLPSSPPLSISSFTTRTIESLPPQSAAAPPTRE